MNRNDANGAEQNRSRLEHIAPAPVSFCAGPSLLTAKRLCVPMKKSIPKRLKRACRL